MSNTRWVIGDVQGLLRTQPGRDPSFTRGGVDAYRVQGISGTVMQLREVPAAPSAWHDRGAAVHLARVTELARRLQQGGLFRRAPRGPLGDLLQFAPGELSLAELERSRGDARLLQLHISEQYPHPDGGWVARYSAIYAAPLPPLPPPLPPPPPPFASEQRPLDVLPPTRPPSMETPPARPQVRAPVPQPTGGDGCLPSLVPDPFGLGALGGCLAGLGGLLLRVLLAAIAILVGTFVLSGLLWGVLLAPWQGSLEALELFRTRIPPVTAGVFGALVGGTALLLWRQRGRKG